MPATALLLALVGLVCLGTGVLARLERLPRNRVLGVRTPWTMSRVDTFRRANRAAAPAFLAAGTLALLAAGVAPLAPVPAAGVTVLVVGLLGAVGLVAAGGVVGARFGEADRAGERARADAGSAPCSGAPDEDPCSPTGGCAGSCALCPRATGAGHP